MFDVWHDAARSYHERLRISLAEAESAHGIVLGALGSSWLARQARRSGLPGRGLEHVHPLFRSLLGGTLESVLEVCELAAYLTFFMRDAKIGEVLDGLRDHGKYPSTFFEVAMAWRFARAGFPISLYPQTGSGVADFAACVGANSTVVEVSVFPGDTFARPAMVYGQALLDAVTRATEKVGLAYFVAVEVVIDVVSEGDFQRKLRGAVVESIRRFARSAEAAARLSVPTTFGAILVRTTRPDEAPIATGNFSACSRRVARPKVGTLHGIQMSAIGGGADWVHLAYDDSPGGQQRQIAGKLKRENAQLSGIAQGRMIVLDVSGLGMGVLSDEDDDTWTTLERFGAQHSSVSEIWLLTRVWSSDPPRWLYRGITYRNPRAAAALPEVVGTSVLADLDVLSA